MSDPLSVLHTSVATLADLVASLDDEDLTRRAYPAEWTVADTLSHLGSGAEITAGLVGFAREGVAAPDDFMSGIWDVWNAKSPRAQADDLLEADRALMEVLDSVDAAEAATLRLDLGEGTDFGSFVGHRRDEHVVHTWDVAVVFDPTVPLAPDAVGQMIDSLGPAAQMSGKPVPDERTVIVHTFDPPRTLRLELGPDAVLLEPESRPDRSLDELHLPGEALIRLVYGRLDADHTPDGVGGTADLDELRGLFTGF